MAKKRRSNGLSFAASLLFILALLALPGAGCGAPDEPDAPGDLTEPLLGTSNSVLNPGFESGLTSWSASVTNGQGTITTDTVTLHSGTQAAKVVTSTLASTPADWHVQLGQTISFTAGSTLRISFWAKSSATRTIGVAVQQGGSTPTLEQDATITATWTKFEMSFTPMSSYSAALRFNCGKHLGTVWIDDVSIVTDRLENPGFEGGLTSWWSKNGAEGTVAADSAVAHTGAGSVKAALTSVLSPAVPWDVQLSQDNLSIFAGQTQMISFWAKASVARPLQVALQQGGNTPIVSKDLNLTTSWAQYLVFATPAVTGSASLRFNLASAVGTVWVDDVAFTSNDGSGTGCTTNPAVPSTLTPLYPGGGNNWTLSWHDEFDGAAVDTASWSVRTGYRYGGYGNQTYQATNVTVSGGCLHAATTKDAQGNYFSGWIDGKDKRSISQGVHVEIRAKVPTGQGIWPALWFDPQSPSTWPPEIDLLEVLGKDSGTAYMTTHYTSSNWSNQGIFKGPDLAVAFHLYTLEWEAGALRWYIDGALKFATTDGVPASPQTFYAILNTAVGSAGEWGGAPDATTVFPQAHDIDYIRVYTR